MPPISTPPRAHICIVQPAGYVHSLGLLDPARYLRFQLRRAGVAVTLGKNRLREDAINFVFGAHLGFPPEWRERHACLFVNLEQLGDGGARVSPQYLSLLRGSGVVDYDASNIKVYCPHPEDVPLLALGHAPYLASADTLALTERPIDLLFVGSLNDRRRRFVERVESTGVHVSVFDHAIYGPERDLLIRQARAVLNCHYYDTNTFEQVRVQHCLSLGTPVISERTATTSVPAAFEDCVSWLNGDGVETFFRERFAGAAWQAEADAQLSRWRHLDPLEDYLELMAFAAGYFRGHASRKPAGSWKPTQLNLGSGRDYRPGWLNVDILDRAEPDLVLDLAQPQSWPLRGRTRFGGQVQLELGNVERVFASNVLEHVQDLPALMTQLLALLGDGGELEVEVPYEKAPTAWQDPTHLRAMNENSWRYYTEWFWYLGWFEHRFEIVHAQWLDAQVQPCAHAQAAFMRVRLRKVRTTPAERTVARTMRADFGELPEDEAFAWQASELLSKQAVAEALGD